MSRLPREYDAKVQGAGKLIRRRRALAAAGVAVSGATLSSSLVGSHAADVPRTWDREYDVVVIGFGVAGAAAAYEAVNRGLKVLVLDRGAAAANASHGSNIYLGSGTPLQQAHGVSDSAEEMEKYLLATQIPGPDVDRIRLYVEKSIEHYHWFSELGIEFDTDPASGSLIYSGAENVFPGNTMARPAMRGHRHANGGTGRWIQGALLDRVRAAGATLQLNAETKRIICSSDGIVQGVVADIDGRSVALRGKRATIIATGGFSRNPIMMEQHAPIYRLAFPLEVFSNDGWGIRAGQAVGGAVRRLGAVCSFFSIGPPESRYEGILVNRAGQRFIAEEDVPWQHRLGDRILREQGGLAYLIVDSKIPVNEPTPGVVAAESATIAELEHAIDLPSQSLRQTVTHYNRYAEEGYDPFFQKSTGYLRPLMHPPYTAIRIAVGEAPLSYFTVGGLQTDTTGRVLDNNARAIPGLFAVGRVAAGILNYSHYLSGLSLGEGTLFGRVVGKSV